MNININMPTRFTNTSTQSKSNCLTFQRHKRGWSRTPRRNIWLRLNAKPLDKLTTAHRTFIIHCNTSFHVAGQGSSPRLLLLYHSFRRLSSTVGKAVCFLMGASPPNPHADEGAKWRAVIGKISTAHRRTVCRQTYSTDGDFRGGIQSPLRQNV